MFTKGRIIFILFFIIVFAIGMIYSYKKDSKRHSTYYKNSAKKVTLWGILVVVVFLLLRYLTHLLN